MVASLIKIQEKGQLVGPLLFLLILLFKIGPNPQAVLFLATFAWVISNWLLTSIPLFVTGIFGVSLAVLLGISGPKEAFSPLADPLIFLFLGGFFLAKAFEVIELDKKISLAILNHPLVCGNVQRTIFAVLALTAFISMWVSNTATTAMMLPLVMGIMKNLNVTDSKAQNALLLGTAYAATIGGLATPLGSPPNIIVIGMLQQLAQIKLNFFTWVIIALPITLILMFWLNLYVQKSFKGLSFTHTYCERKTEFTTNDKILIMIFFTAILFWFFPSLLSLWLGEKHPMAKLLDERLNPGIISIFLACFLFLFPINKKEKILKVHDAFTIDWGSLLLFGTGLSLGQMLFKVGIADWIGNHLMGLIGNAPFIIFLASIVTFTVFFTELVSNTAAANILLPLLIGSCLKANINPLIIAMACALSCNLAFMLPVGTPPNAIVYGTGLVSLKEMARQGMVLNIVSIILITTVFYFSQFFL